MLFISMCFRKFEVGMNGHVNGSDSRFWNPLWKREFKHQEKGLFNASRSRSNMRELTLAQKLRGIQPVLLISIEGYLSKGLIFCLNKF